jgi:hypothetical protein
MGSPKESLKKKNIFAEKYDEIRRLDGIASKSAILKRSSDCVVLKFVRKSADTICRSVPISENRTVRNSHTFAVKGH